MPYRLNPITGQIDYFNSEDLAASHNHDAKYYPKSKIDELISSLLKGFFDLNLETFLVEGAQKEE